MSLYERVESELNATEAETERGLSRDARGLVDRLRAILGQHRESESFETFVIWDDVLEHVRENGEAWIVMPGRGDDDPTLFGATVLEGSVHARAEGKFPPAFYGEETLGRFRKEKQKAGAIDSAAGSEVVVPEGETGYSVEQAQAKLDSWAEEVDEEEAREFKRELFMRLLLQKGGNEMQYCWETAQKAWADKPEDC